MGGRRAPGPSCDKVAAAAQGYLPKQTVTSSDLEIAEPLMESTHGLAAGSQNKFKRLGASWDPPMTTRPGTQEHMHLASFLEGISCPSQARTSPATASSSARLLRVILG